MINRPDLIIPLIVFCIVAFFTPGPNNLMLMTSGLNFGLKRTLPHALGVMFGYPLLALCVGLGLGAIFTSYPLIYVVIKYAGAAYMLYLAWLIAESDPPVLEDSAVTGKQPFTFLQAVAFQWVNPKAWVMAIGSASSYAAIAPYPANMLLLAVLYIIVGAGSCLTWAGLGMVLQNFLHKPKIVRAFNVTMAMLLAASLYPIFADAWR